ncbi:hypothetical protein BpHYR1_014557 [Brachionus plicatilis]|uniref:Uncharacterized protein n=1 Tax=Brachionus plicatilis TaxID=10195 RepID=A0A3M7PTR3_BRAPC|nr:hypothetical protein BpHYR1_014557 [Brachionus plicatilis]
MRKYFSDESLRIILKPIDKNIKRNYLRRKKRVKKSIDSYSQYRDQHLNSNLQIPYKSSQKEAREFINFKLGDLINQNKTLLKNLYAQINSNSNKINLFYLPAEPNNSRGSNQLLYNDVYGRLNLIPVSGLADNSSNDNNFYLSAINLENNWNKQISNFNLIFRTKWHQENLGILINGYHFYFCIHLLIISGFHKSATDKPLSMMGRLFKIGTKSGHMNFSPVLSEKILFSARLTKDITSLDLKNNLSSKPIQTKGIVPLGSSERRIAFFSASQPVFFFLINSKFDNYLEFSLFSWKFNR